MDLSESERTFIEQHPQAMFVTVGPDGLAKAVRVAVTFVDGQLWSSGTRERVRTRRLQEDPRCTLCFLDTSPLWLTVEATVRIIEGPEVPDLSVRLFRSLQGRPEGDLWWFDGEYDDEGFKRIMIQDQRLIYEFDVTRTYGMTELVGDHPPQPATQDDAR